MFGQLVIASLIGLSSLTAASVAEAAPPRDLVREQHQDARIGEGIASGELTRGEAARLHREQVRIDRMQRRARADGHVGPVERARIERAQDRASHHIAAAKHNGRKR